MKLEKQIEEAVCDYARSKGIMVRKYTSPSTKFVPDRIFFIPGGKPLLVEFKRPSGSMSPGQHREIIRLRQAGYNVKVIDNVEDGKRAIDAAITLKVQKHLDEIQAAVARVSGHSHTPHPAA